MMLDYESCYNETHVILVRGSVVSIFGCSYLRVSHFFFISFTLFSDSI